MTSNNYPNLVTEIYFELTVAGCSEVNFVTTKSGSDLLPMYFITEIDQVLDIVLPDYVPVPECRGDTNDITYSEVGRSADWISFSERDRIVTAQPTSVLIPNGAYPVIINLHYREEEKIL